MTKFDPPWIQYPIGAGRMLLATVMLLASLTAQAELHWPQEILAEEGTIVVYQPQPESLEGNVLSGRAAVALEINGHDEPIFGAMWFTARLDTDRDAGTARVHDVRVANVVWPESRDADEQRFTAIVEGSVPETGFLISLERLSASLEIADLAQKSLESLNTEPPAIVFREELAVLLLYDGEPRLANIDNSPYARVLNAPMAVVCRQRGNECWLSSGTLWYTASNPLGPWTATRSPPADLEQMMPVADSPEPAPDVHPAIVVATEPTELIVTVGKPEWTALTGGDLLYAANTESPWLRELGTGNMYLLLSGRWFRSRTNAGPWVFVKPDELPASFAAIPPASDIGGLRSSVAGTPEAQDAVRDAAIPQTAAIQRSEASLTVEYDGEPRFEPIKGTEVAYAVNTGAQVLRIDSRYYAVDNGVWFVSSAATGPWRVADEVPGEKIAAIPPSSPVYNTTYVEIYQSTPEVVYVGYRPGYLWSFPYYGVPVYGTGWYYPPYYGHWYYPRPPTWGFNMGYNPWTGWNFGLSYSSGFFRFGMSWGGGYGSSYRPWQCCGGWYGGGYRGPTIINTGDINIGNNINIGNRARISNRLAETGRPVGNRMDRSANVYNRPETRDRLADPSAVARDLRQARPVTGRDNNVFADRSGQVARLDGDRWQTREAGGWKDTGAVADRRPIGDSAVRPTAPATRPSTRPTMPDTRPATRPAVPDTRPATRPAGPASRPATPATRPASRPSLNTYDLNRSHHARQRGATREMARPMPHGPAGRPMSRPMPQGPAGRPMPRGMDGR